MPLFHIDINELPEDVLDFLIKQAASKGISISELISQILEEVRIAKLQDDSKIQIQSGNDGQENITIESGKRGGQPCIRGLRITVYDVLSWLAQGMDKTEILEDFPELTLEDILACQRFAADREHNIRSIKSA